jgi:hypothetical protein
LPTNVNNPSIIKLITQRKQYHEKTVNSTNAGCSITLLTPGLSSAALVNSQIGLIEKMYSYAEYEGGAVTIAFTTGNAKCPNGVWLTPTSTGFDTLLSFALAAYMADKKVYFGIYDDRLFTGGADYCQVDSVRIGETK